MGSNAKLEFSLETINPYLAKACVTVPASCVDALFYQSSLQQQQSIKTHGFHKGTTPISYIEQHFKTHLCEHIKEFLFKYSILPFLYSHLHKIKFLLAGEPRLTSIELELHKDGIYQFDLSLAPKIALKDWKSFPFKAPKRKKYKDIDRQVETFISQEEEAKKQLTNGSIHVGDWVCFDISLVDEHNQPLLPDYKENLWIKIGSEEADNPAKETFLNKTVSSSFCSESICLQDYFSSDLDTKYLYRIDIIDIVHQEYFCFESFKKHFNIKTQKDVVKKLIEVHSFRNDLSQRRAIVEETFKLLFAKHHIDIPSHIILRQQEQVLDSVRENPDYLVYKTEKQFEKYVRLLASKQAKEQILIDQLMYSENITATHDDIKNYLMLTQRPRTKELLYFCPPVTKYKGQEFPISTSLLEHSCMREKALNHVIHNLSRK